MRIPVFGGCVVVILIYETRSSSFLQINELPCTDSPLTDHLWMIRPKLFICQTVLKSQTLCDMQSEQFVSRIEIIGPDGSGRGKVRWLYETKIGSTDLFFTPRPWRTSNCPVQLLYESFLTEVFFSDLSTVVDNHSSSFPSLIQQVNVVLFGPSLLVIREPDRPP